MRIFKATFLALSLVCSSAPAIAQFHQIPYQCVRGYCLGGNPDGDGVVRRPWHDTAYLATGLARFRDWDRAVVTLLAALSQLEQAIEVEPRLAELLGYDQFTLYSMLGEYHNSQGKPHMALPYLLRAAAVADAEISLRAARDDPNQPSLAMSDWLATVRTTMNLNAWIGVYMTRRLVTPELVGGKAEPMLSDRLPDINLTELSLVEAYVKMGRSADAYAVYDGPFQRYLARMAANANPQSRANLNTAVEVACLRMGMALAELGPSPQADAAFHCAMEVSGKNFAVVGVGVTRTSPAVVVEALVERRRLILGASAAYFLQVKAGQGQPPVMRQLLQMVAETKGASSRYRERRRAIWAHSTDPELLSNRQAFVDHERSLTEVPMGERVSVALSAWTNKEVALMAAHHGAFSRAGLQRVFANGEEIIERTHSELRKTDSSKGESTALIGYALYRPVDFKAGHLGAPRLLRYVVTSIGVDLRDIGEANAITRKARLWRSDILTESTVATSPSAMKRSAELSTQLLGDLPQAVLNAKNWVIDPDGVLNLLPFEALSLPGTAASVIERHTLRYVTSIADFADPSDPANMVSAIGEAVVVGDPVYAGAQIRNGDSAVGALRAASGKFLRDITLQPLPETRAEALQVAASLKSMGVASQVYLGDDATIEKFHFVQAPRFLHVATHGLFLEPGIELNNGVYVRLASALPGMQSALALSPSSKTEAGLGNSFLTGADITQLNLLGTELAVFSACDTGNGEFETGEGVVSLRRAAEEAGARSSITSLWPVPSKATAVLMADFYARLATGQSKSEALRQAKLNLKKTSPSPLHWAGFLLAGEP